MFEIAPDEDHDKRARFQERTWGAAFTAPPSKRSSNRREQGHGEAELKAPPLEIPTPAKSSNGWPLRPGEEDWRERLQRLSERFPTAGADSIAQILRDNAGHAGKAAAALRDLTRV